MPSPNADIVIYYINSHDFLRHYIQTLYTDIFFLISVSLGSTSECPGSRYNDKCYIVLGESSQWEVGRQLCKDRHGRLPLIVDLPHAEFLSDFTQKQNIEHAWINARRIEHNWHWASCE